MRLNDFFERIYCINLPERRDRRERCEQIFEELEIEVEMVRAMPGPATWRPDFYPHPMRAFDGVAGCTQVHLQILSSAYANMHESILILEDDCEFAPNFVHRFNTLDIPGDWRMFYLGGMYNDSGNLPERVNNDVARIYSMMSSHAVGIHSLLFSTILSSVFSDWPYLRDSIDGYYTDFQRYYQAYAPIVPMIWQRADHSDVQGAHRDYVDIFKKPLL
jgi:hypothetical protein